MEEIQKLLYKILSAIVDDTSAISIERRNDEMGVLFSVRVAPSDMGKVVGREGGMITSIRNILRAAGFKSRAKINIKLEEPHLNVASIV